MELQCEQKILQHKCQGLEQSVAKYNWNEPEKTNIIDVRRFINFFDRNLLNFNIPIQHKRFEKFIHTKCSELAEWGLSEEAFKQVFPLLCEKLCQFVHPMFKISNNLVLNESLEPIEIKIIGFLWDVFPLPKEKLFINESKNYQ